ncbi:MAG: hypothetical protein IPM39_01125 [Chloroflexi bacterium]|nr:hypothetical protein [Chloroflexota bacterium]
MNSKRLRFGLLVWLVCFVLSCVPVQPGVGLAASAPATATPVFLPMITRPSNTFYVATSGSDTGGDGTAARPWRSIGYAVTAVFDGAIILVQPGTYTGQIDIRRQLAEGITIRSEIPYQARLRHSGSVITCFFCRDITIEGFDIAHAGSGAGRYIIQIQDVRNDGVGGSHVTLRNNILHDSYNNDILKINNGAHDILIEGNVLYNQSGLDEHIDLTSAYNITIQDNIFFNDFAGSGRPNLNDTAGFILMKDVDEDADGILGTHNVIIRRNVFLNWSGNNGDGFVTMGDNSPRNYYHAYNILIENNLMLGNTANVIHAALKVVGSSDVIFRHNTVVGDMPAKSFAFRLTTGNLPNENIRFYNNIWSDPTGTMGAEFPGDWNRFSRTTGTASFFLGNNLYWNGGQAIPFDGDEPINFTNDVARIVADPLLPEGQQTIVAPRWQPENGRFADNSRTIGEAFVRLVQNYGQIGPGSAALDTANPTYAPTEDILGHPRLTPDVGAFEYQP